MYQEKYDEFQQTLTKSNDVFQNFKNEMDKVMLLLLYLLLSGFICWQLHRPAGIVVSLTELAKNGQLN